MRYPLCEEAECACSKSTPILRAEHVSGQSIVSETAEAGQAFTFVLKTGWFFKVLE